MHTYYLLTTYYTWTFAGFLICRRKTANAIDLPRQNGRQNSKSLLVKNYFPKWPIHVNIFTVIVKRDDYLGFIVHAWLPTGQTVCKGPNVIFCFPRYGKQKMSFGRRDTPPGGGTIRC